MRKSRRIAIEKKNGRVGIRIREQTETVYTRLIGLACFEQKVGYIYNSKGQYMDFGKE